MLKSWMEKLSWRVDSPDLEHHQVVVVPLYLQDAGQSHHTCFEVWRVTWGREEDSSIVRAECGGVFFWEEGGFPDLLSRLTRGSTALGLLEAASGSHFLYFSTEQRSKTHC